LLILSVIGASGLADHPERVSDAELFAAIDLNRPGLEDVRDAVGREDYLAAAEAWAAYFRARTHPTPHFDRAVWPDFIRENYPQLVPSIIEEASRIADGHVAHGPFVLQVDGDDIDWKANPTRDTNYVSVVGSQWFMNYLGRAYLLSREERYAEAFARIFDSWYEHQDEILKEQGGLGFDPVYRAYYPGIRTRILADNYYSLAASPALSPDLHVKIMKQLLGSSMWLHARNGGYKPGNQQVAAVVGLGIAGLMFPEFKDASAWVDRTQSRMQEHLRQDFFEDGGHAELCTQYHKTCLRDLGYFALTAEKNGRPSLYTSEDAPAFERAYDWLAKLIMPTGETPALHSAVYATDWAIHLTAAGRYFDRPDLLALSKRFWDKGIVPSQKGPVSLATFMVSEAFVHPVEAAAPPQPTGAHLAASGFVVHRTGWEETSRYCLFQYGWPKSGHAYPGALSFMLAMNGELVATHPGSPRSYRDPSYQYCHSTQSHNLVTIDLVDHALNNRFAPGGELHAYADLPGAWYVRGSQDGYAKVFGVAQERSVLILEDGPMVIRDTLSGGEGHTAHWNFHTPLGVSVDEENTVTLAGKRTYQIRPAQPDEITAVKVESHWAAVLPRDSQPGDCGKEIPVVRFEKPMGSDGAKFCMVLTEGDGKIAPLSEHAVRISASDTEYVVQYATTKDSRTTGVSSDAECVCVRYKNGVPDAAWMINGTHLSIGEARWLDQEAAFTGRLSPGLSHGE
jgi:hypothetical protein